MPFLRSIPAVLVLTCGVAAAERAPRYVAMLASGQRIEGDRLTNWHDSNAVPQLAGQSLLAPSNPLRWLRNCSQPLADPPTSYVEFTSGDRLPGEVVDYRSGSEDPYHPKPAHFIVRVPLAFEAPDNKPIPEIRVATRFVSRIVWQRSERQRLAPGSVLFRDGRSLKFRAIRFQPGTVNLLTADGGQRIAWSELAELRLAVVEPWAAWFDQLAAVCTSAQSRMIEIETSSGLVATASLDRLAARFEGNSADPDLWVHGLQPAWSLDILWVPFREIAYYRMFAPHEVPLSRIAPRQIEHREALAGAPTMEVNRSVAGTPLCSQSLVFGWGLGVSGGTDLSFDLPAAARTLQGSVCLDRTVGSGGCIRPRVFVQASQAGSQNVPALQGNPLWEGPILVGSGSVAETGLMKLGEPSSGRTLVLQTDMVAHERPPGADPLNIRDFANWCDLVLTLDPAAVETELHKRTAHQFAAWQGWTVGFGEQTVTRPPVTRLELLFSRNREVPGAFEPLIRTERAPLVLRRELTIGPNDHWLIIAAVARPKNLRPQAKLEVWIAGRRVSEFLVPDERENPAENRPITVSLAAYQQLTPAKFPVEIRQLPQERGQSVIYRAITTSEHLPASGEARL
jgi:hypothetical protein